MPKGKPIAPLDLEELENSPSLEGMLAFRETPAAPARSANSVGAAPIGDKPRGPAPGGRAPVDLTPLGTTPAGPVAEPSNSGPDLSTVLAQLADLPRPAKSRGKTIRATRVEDGHSQTQDTLYWYLWRTGKQVNASRSRFVQAGYGQIQAALGIDRSNVQDAIRELLKKFSIRVFRASTVGSVTIYEVSCCEDILAKRRSEGLIWARRYGTRRADLLTSPDEQDAIPADTAPIGLGPIGAPSMGVAPRGGLTPTDPVGAKPTPGVGATPIQLVTEANSKTRTSSTALQAVVRCITNELGLVDDAAARQILDRCYERAPDVTVHEIIHFVRLQAARIRGMKRIDNPIGLLIAQVPRCFEGESFRQFRRQQQGREVDSAEHEQYLAGLRAKLEDLQTPSDEKQLIRQVLGEF